jgi:hypothetical protein
LFTRVFLYGTWVTFLVIFGSKFFETHFIWICISTFVEVDNSNRFTIVFINFSILNIICESFRIMHLNSISMHIQIRCTGMLSVYGGPCTIWVHYHDLQLNIYRTRKKIIFFWSKRSLIQFGSEFDMKDLGPLSYFLGTVVTR